MKFERACIPLGCAWSSPFVRWQGSLAEVSSMDLAVHVTRDALAARGIEPKTLTQLVMGFTVPQNDSFYAAPWTAARIGAEGISGPVVMQACATSVAALVAAAAAVESDTGENVLVVTTDRTSNGPLMIYPGASGMGGSPQVEHWVLDNFAADPWTGEAMIATAENVARAGGLSREALDDLTMLRYEQYLSTLANDRAIQRRYLQAVVLPGKKGASKEIAADEGIHPYSRENLRGLRPAVANGTTTFGSQTHPADGCAGAIVCNQTEARRQSKGEGVVRLIGARYARAEKGYMPKAATMAAQRVVADAGISFGQIRAVVTHNPFAVNDAWFCQQTGYPAERMNQYGCSLIYGHPQGPTGMRGIAELIETLRQAGGGIGLFTGCAAGDTGGALLLSVEP